jgi:radical SAM protein with 4Fe4S-binding SPASM domain
MSEELFSHVLDELEGKTDCVYYHLMGEPLTHPLLPRFLSLARARGFRSVITTNGTLLPERGGELIAAGLYKISVSVHSLEDASDGEVEQYLRGVAAFAVRAAAEGVIVVLRLWNNGFDEGLNARVERVLKEYFPEQWHTGARGTRIRERIYLEGGERFAWPDEAAPDGGECVFCYGLRDHFGILVDGTVVPCCLDSDGIINLGNIFEQDIDEILNSERAQAIVKGFDGRTASEELCRRCAYARRFK